MIIRISSRLNLHPYLNSAASDHIGLFTAGFSVVLGAYLAGTAFALNPLGDDRPMFPLLFLTSVRPETLIRSRVFASVAVGVPVTTLGLLAAFLLGAPLLVVLVFAVVGSVFCFESAMFSVGIGATQPAYEPKQYWGMETIVPSFVPTMVWINIVCIGTTIGTVVVLFLAIGRLSFIPIISVGLLVYGLITVGIPYWSYRYAVRRVREYTIE